MADVLKAVGLVGGRQGRVGGGAQVRDHRQQRRLTLLLQRAGGEGSSQVGVVPASAYRAGRVEALPARSAGRNRARAEHALCPPLQARPSSRHGRVASAWSGRCGTHWVPRRAGTGRPRGALPTFPGGSQACSMRRHFFTCPSKARLLQTCRQAGRQAGGWAGRLEGCTVRMERASQRRHARKMC